jgi:dTDP-4-dehydrorhamnose 3,5-epimerase
MIRSHRPGQQRGWIGHRKEAKWFVAAAGTVLVAVVKVDDWENPSRDLPVQRFVLSAVKPAVLHVPAGHATGSISLSADGLLLVFSSGHLEPSSRDECRFAKDTWPVQR